MTGTSFYVTQVLKQYLFYLILFKRGSFSERSKYFRGWVAPVANETNLFPLFRYQLLRVGVAPRFGRSCVLAKNVIGCCLQNAKHIYTISHVISEFCGKFSYLYPKCLELSRNIIPFRNSFHGPICLQIAEH